MTERDRDLARFLMVYADAAEAGGVRDFGFMREAARRLLELSREAEPKTSSQRTTVCRGCGTPLVQPATGRPRQWCREKACRTARRAGKSRKRHPGADGQVVRSQGRQDQVGAGPPDARAAAAEGRAAVGA